MTFDIAVIIKSRTDGDFKKLENRGMGRDFSKMLIRRSVCWVSSDTCYVSKAEETAKSRNMHIYCKSAHVVRSHNDCNIVFPVKSSVYIN